MRKAWTTLWILSVAGVAWADIHVVPNPQGPLAGLTVVVSPGHGKDYQRSAWRYQRGVTHTLREDVHTNEITTEYLQRLLVNAGARVVSCRERSFQRHEVVVDDADAGFSASAGWTTASSAAGRHGVGYHYAGVDAQGAATATFRPNLPAAGRYPVYVWFPTGGNRAPDATYAVHHTGGVSRVTLDQRGPGDHWVFLGEFHFAAGTTGKVVLSSRSAHVNAVVIADAVRFGGGVGPSGEPRWRESARSFLAHKGFASGQSDITVRPAYGVWLAGGDTSRWRDDMLYLALHSNASGGSGGARGLSTFSYSNGRSSFNSPGPAHYPTRPSRLDAASDAFRDALHAQVLADVRAGFEPSWQDRRTNLANFGELREARSFPSALIELGFHDNADDAALLASAAFRATAARAIYKGILRYRLGAGSTVLPLAPAGLRVENVGGGQLRVSWSTRLDPLEPSAAPTAWKVYTSPDGRGFDDGVVVQGTSHTLAGYAAGQRVFVRVAALNAGGESLPSAVGGAQVGSGGPALVVDGFDRAYVHRHDDVDARFTHDQAVAHVEALGRAAPDAAIDYAANEAVLGGVALGGYELVDWVLGRESSLDRTFDADEQRLVEAYLAGGGALLTSGSEIGWDLEARSGGSRFLRDVLGVDYLADDAGVHAVRGQPGTPLARLGNVALHDGRAGSYAVETPDVFAPAHAQARALFAWDAAGAPAAGIAQSSPHRVVVLAFPLEGVVDAGQRDAITRDLVAELVPGGLTPGGAPGATPSQSPTPGQSPAPGQTPPQGQSTTPGASGTTAAGATPAAAPSGGSGGGGCALAPAAGTGSGPAWLWLAALLLGLRLRRTR